MVEMEVELEGSAAGILESGGGGGAERLLNMSSGSSVAVHYHSRFGPHDELLLLEVDPSLLPHFLHNRVTIRGQINEDAVLCTPSSSYALKFTGNSNSVFLIPAGDPSNAVNDSAPTENEAGMTCISKEVVSVLKVAPGNMELVQVAPKLDKLKSLLRERPYRLEEENDVDLESSLEERHYRLEEEDMEMESKDTNRLYSWENLVEVIQASDSELMEGLKAMSAIEINGFWRIVDEKAMDNILKLILHNAIIHDWSLNALREDEVLSTLEADGFPPRIVRHCLYVYGTEVSTSGSCIWRLDEKKLSVRYARQILNGGKLKLENFMQKWVSTLPPEIHPELQFLEGEVLYEKIGIETWIRSFSVSTLPRDPAERFAALFRERLRWEGRDLQPYIRDLHVPGLSAESLLIKYTRRSQATGEAEPIFSAR